jgi:ribosomal RNA-processing protein 9
VCVQLRGHVFDARAFRVYRGHQGPVTSVTLTANDETAYTGSKDCSIIRWDMDSVRNGKRVIYKGARNRPHIKGHTLPILSVSVSDDGKLLASGGDDKLLHVWDTGRNAIAHTFSGHKARIASVCFRKASHQVISGSYDRQRTS